MGLIWVFLAVLGGAQSPLHDGVAATATIDAVIGGNFTFSFYVNSTAGVESLFITTTTFTDWASPELFISAGQVPSREAHAYAASPGSEEEVEIPREHLSANMTYYILAECATYCRFSILASLVADVELPSGAPLRFSLDAHQMQVFTYEVVEEDPAELSITLTPLGHSEVLTMIVNEGTRYGPLKQVEKAWLVGQSCVVAHPKRTKYWITVSASQSAGFTLAAGASAGTTELQASTPIYGVIAPRQWKQYKIYVSDPDSTVYIMETIYSGSPSLYIRSLDSPSLEFYDFVSVAADNETVAIDKHQRISLMKPVGWYFIGVYAVVPSAFVLTTSVNINGLVPLHTGVSYSGFVDNRERFYFYISLPPRESLHLGVKVQTLRGELAVFMKLCRTSILADACKLTEEEISHPERSESVHTAKESHAVKEIDLKHASSQCPQDFCRYTILVLGKSQERATFLISASIADGTVHSLRSGVPYFSSLRPHETLYLQRSVLDGRVLRLSFQLTVYSGKCSLCVSPFVEKPASTECVKYSQLRGDPNDQGVAFTKGLDFDSLNITFYASIRAEESSTFSVLAQETVPDANTITRLFRGQTQREFLYREEEGRTDRMYSFEIYYPSGMEQDVYVTLTPLSGVFTLYISNNASDYLLTYSFSYQWSSDISAGHGERQNSVRIRPADLYYLPISTYLVLVRVEQWPGNGVASYSLVFTSGDGSRTTLQKGTPISDVVAMGSYRFYTLPVHQSNQTLTASVSAITGDPDLYVSTNSSNHFPSVNHFDYASANYGSEVVSILWSGGNGDEVYLAVFGYTDSEYVLTANVEDGSPTYLVAGTPQVGGSQHTEYRYYSLFIDPLECVLVTVQFFVGESRVFANWEAVTANRTRDWNRPTEAVNMAHSSELPGSARLSLRSSDLTPSCTSTARCRFDISILCDSPDCRFQISVTQTEEMLLAEGSPVTAVCQKNTPVGFRFYNERESTNLMITVSAVTSGDPDIYVSKDAKPLPSRNMWYSATWGNEFLEIPVTDPIVGPALMKGDYFIAVLCDRNMTFSVVVTTNPKGLIRLQSGQPHEGLLYSKPVEYYYFPSALPEDIIISLTTRSGSATMYAITHDNDRDDIYDRLPNSTFYVWKSTTGKDITIRQNDSLFCLGCNVVIGVERAHGSCLYTVMARNTGHITTLLNGQPAEGTVDKEQAGKYVFHHFDNSSLDLSLAVFSGSPQMNIDTIPLVSASSRHWHTHGSDSVHHVHIAPTDPNFHIGLYYIQVASEIHSSFSLTAHSAGSVVHVMTGWPQVYSTELVSHTPIIFEHLTETSGGSCKVVSNTKDFFPVVYATFTQTEEIGFTPSAEHYDMKFSEYDMFYELKLPLWGLYAGKYLFSVFGNSTRRNSTAVGDFEFYCISGSHSKVLVLQQTDRGVVDSDTPQINYEIQVTQGGLLHVELSPCSGALELFVAMVSDAGTEVREKRIDDGKIRVVMPCAPGVYGVSVMGLIQEEMQRSVSYELHTFITQPGGASPRNSYYPGSTISWTEAGPGLLNVTWAPPVTESGEAILSPQFVKYRVYASGFSGSLQSACSMDTYQQLGLAWLALPEIEVYGLTSASIKIPPSTTIWINVLAIIDPEEGPEIYHVAYLETEVRLGDEEEEAGREREMRMMLAALAGIVFLLLLGLVILIMKYRSARKLQLRLVEMLGVETITMDFNKVLKSPRIERRSLEFAPLPQETSRSAD